MRGNRAVAVWDDYTGGPCYADPDAIDLTSYYEKALADIASSQIGREIILPLLTTELEIGFDERDFADAEQIALAEGCNAKQAEAVGMAYGAEQITCIQGPPVLANTRPGADRSPDGEAGRAHPDDLPHAHGNQQCPE